MTVGWLAAAIGVVLVIVLVWMNARFLRNSDEKSAQNNLQTEGSAAETEQSSQEQPIPPSRPDLADEDIPVTSEDMPVTPMEEVEVVHTASTGMRLFERSDYPFRLYETTVPMFSDDIWKRSFTRLTQDPQVLGWVAFQDDLIGAADREYETNFLEVLRTYRRTVERLRQEIGLSQVQETSVVGEEGKVWFLTAVDGAWLALFLDANVDPKQLADRLLAPVRSES